VRGDALSEPRQWLTPKSDSFESFVFFVVRVLVVLALVAATIYLAIVGSLTAASGTGLLAAAAALQPRG
jgi:small-conductance mechanosensitive channel